MGGGRGGDRGKWEGSEVFVKKNFFGGGGLGRGQGGWGGSGWM